MYHQRRPMNKCRRTRRAFDSSRIGGGRPAKIRRSLLLMLAVELDRREPASRSRLFNEGDQGRETGDEQVPAPNRHAITIRMA
jgi:hypothetical protein